MQIEQLKNKGVDVAVIQSGLDTAYSHAMHALSDAIKTQGWTSTELSGASMVTQNMVKRPE